jgi:hypothetical protein
MRQFHLCLAIIVFAILAFVAKGAQEPKMDPKVLFPIEQNGMWGYIDKSGNVVIPPNFDLTDHFEEGMA